jgi:prepilin-type N-terminal cleavage/methylation domain-containing protein
MKRRAFTLVELLIVMMIMGILASIVLFALASVQESVRVDKTKATINKLNAIVMAKWDSYKTRRVPISIPAGTQPKAAAQYRLDTLRELMRMEMPDRYSDILDPPVNRSRAGDSMSPLIAVPGVTLAYRNALSSNRTDQFENAECLYLFITKGSGDVDVMEQFRPDEIGDTDGDGMNEFLDGWGRPINFLRWAAGFHSPLQPADAKEHDPFDPLRVYSPSAGDANYPNGVYPPLYPMIFSPGPDHRSEIQDGGGNPPYHASKTSPPNNPYATVAGGLLGSWLDDPEIKPPPPNYVPVDESIDNITNQDGE